MKKDDGSVQNQEAVDEALAKRGIPPVDQLTNPENLSRALQSTDRGFNRLMTDVTGRHREGQ